MFWFKKDFTSFVKSVKCAKGLKRIKRAQPRIKGMSDFKLK